MPSALDGNYNIENLDDENPTKILGMLGNLFSWKLDDYDKCLHSDMVYEALFSLDTYESIQWNNKKNNTLGEIIIVRMGSAFKQFYAANLAPRSLTYHISACRQSRQIFAVSARLGWTKWEKPEFYGVLFSSFIVTAGHPERAFSANR